jgi:hypothetical protein
MAKEALGIQGFTTDDARFVGSRFGAVREALFANPYQRVWGGHGEPPLPLYPVTLGGLLRGLVSRGKGYAFLQAARRAVDSQADLRWGPDRKGYRRLLHPNGVCLTGTWQITGQSDYTGYFGQGSRGLVIARYSTCCSETRSGHTRSLALVARLYPTVDAGHPTPLPTAGFITQQDFGGERVNSIQEAVLQNAPDTRSWRRGSGVPGLMVTGLVFLRVDKQPTIRQLYQVAELGKPSGMPTRAPEFMRLSVASARPPTPFAPDVDFRDEILGQIFDRGDPTPKRKLTFRIETSDSGRTRGTPLFERRLISNWREMGTITFDDAVASYNGDFVVHFSHPAWRGDRNDPSTATRKAMTTVG